MHIIYILFEWENVYNNYLLRFVFSIYHGKIKIESKIVFAIFIFRLNFKILDKNVILSFQFELKNQV
jgi:hypothetical protein